MIHIYYGLGKGKTCSAVGQTLRMVGHGRKALFCQFLKDGLSGEVNILKNNENITYKCPYYHLDKDSNQRLFNEVKILHFFWEYDIIVLDEILDVIAGYGINKIFLIRFIEQCKIYNVELILTGHFRPDNKIEELGDYITYFEKQKHPYDKGIKAREGVEY